MLESALDAPIHFTIEFSSLVVAAGAALLVPARPLLFRGRALGRITASAGFMLIAIASALHGAAFVALDSDALLVGLRVSGWLIVALGLAGALTSSTGYRLAAIGAAAFLLGVGAEALAAVAQEPGDLYDDFAHVARAGATIALAVFVWAGVRSSIRSRFVWAFAALLIVVLLALSTSLNAVISNNVEREELDRVRTQLNAAMQSIEGQERDVGEFVRAIQESNGIPEAIATGGDLTAIALALATETGGEVDFVAFLDPSGDLLAAGGRGPSLIGEDGELETGDLAQTDLLVVLGSPIVRTLDEQQKVAVGIDHLVGDAIAILGAGEIQDPSNPTRRVGVVVVGRHLDAATIDEISHRVEPAAATLLLGNRVVATTLATGMTLPDEIRGLDNGTAVLEQRVGDDSYFSAFSRLNSVTGEVTLALSSPTEIIASTRRDVIRSLFLAALGVGIVALFLAWLSGRRITRPIEALTKTAHAVRTGDVDARVRVGSDDEIGQLGETFNEMTGNLVRASLQEQALRARIETIIQSMADGLVAVDSEKRVLAFNVEAELLTGVRAETALGRTIDDVLDVRDARGESVRLPIHSLREGAVGGVYMARRYGVPIPVAVTSAILRGENDGIAGGVAVIRDMSREHELEKIKGEFLSNISHELRTPLTPIKGYAELLTRPNLPSGKADKFARGILESTQRLERIVALLVDYSSMEAGRLTPRTSSVDIGSIVEDLADEWSDRAPRHDVAAAVNGSLPRVAGDERLLRRSLEEIVDNAIKFSPNGGHIRLEARRGAAGNGLPDDQTFVEVSVTDEGIGIPAEDLPKIFSDFHQVDSSETRTYGGLGLGLAFVQRIVQAHQGQVRVESEPDKGTRLTIAIPALGEASATQ
jgi:PAS domain S-box-containing protein